MNDKELVVEYRISVDVPLLYKKEGVAGYYFWSVRDQRWKEGGVAVDVFWNYEDYVPCIEEEAKRIIELGSDEADRIVDIKMEAYKNRSR